MGTSRAHTYPINALNIDAHTDLRSIDYRHSGNGFTYALQKDSGPALNRYALFGLHKNYTPQYILDFMEAHSDVVQYKFMEDIGLENDVLPLFDKVLDFVSESIFGLEVDCDVITDFPSSAQTPSSFSLNQVRQLVIRTAQRKNCAYLHLCEAAPSKKNSGQVGKALSYIVTDFIRSYNEHNSLP